MTMSPLFPVHFPCLFCNKKQSHNMTINLAGLGMFLVASEASFTCSTHGAYTGLLAWHLSIRTFLGCFFLWLLLCKCNCGR